MVLDDVLRVVGSPDDLAELRCGVAWIDARLFDQRGALLADFQVHHEFDLRQARRDRLLFSHPERGPTKVFGRDANVVFAELHGMAWTSLEAEAGDELELMGLLLRAPWCFASDDYVVLGRDAQFIWRGRPHQRIRIERRAMQGQEVGPSASASGDRFELILDTARLEPVALRISWAKGRPATTILLSDYKAYGRVRLPTRRVFLGAGDTPALEMTLSRIDLRQDLPASQFRPGR